MQIEALKKLQAYNKEAWIEHINKTDFENFKNATLKRQFQNLALLGNLIQYSAVRKNLVIFLT